MLESCQSQPLLKNSCYLPQQFRSGISFNSHGNQYLKMALVRELGSGI